MSNVIPEARQVGNRVRSARDSAHWKCYRAVSDGRFLGSIRGL